MFTSARVAVFFLGILGVLAFVAVYVHRRIGSAFALSPRAHRTAGAVMASALAVMIAGRLGWLGASGPLAAAIAAMAVLAMVMSVPFLVGVDMLALLSRVRLPRRAKAEPAHPIGPPLSRRNLVVRAAHGSALAVATSASGYGTLFGRHDYQVEDVVVRLPNLPKALDGFTLVQLSDIHFGVFVGEAERRSAEALVKKAKPDAIVLTGDLVDHDPAFAPLLGNLVTRLGPLARHGVFAIPGNHDYYAGIDTVLATLRAARATVLVNGAHVLNDGGHRFSILGVDDVWATRLDPSRGPNLHRALEGTPDDRPRILLAHNPVFFPEAAGRIDLQLSGHTHGGQVELGWNPANVVLPFGYIAGAYRRAGSTLYVNRGFGTAGPPSRIGVPPEVTRVILTT